MSESATRWIPAALAATSLSAFAQSIGPVANLSFGSFIAGSGGTISVSAAGARSSTGGVLPLGQGSGVAAAQFNVSGTANASYTITLPANNTVVLVDAAANTMALSSFVANPPTGTLSAGGSQSIRVGATLIVGNAQPSGSYSGSFNVTVNY